MRSDIYSSSSHFARHSEQTLTCRVTANCSLRINSSSSANTSSASAGCPLRSSLAYSVMTLLPQSLQRLLNPFGDRRDARAEHFRDLAILQSFSTQVQTVLLILRKPGQRSFESADLLARDQ